MLLHFLVCNFQETCEPVMCCYKLITCKFKWFGLQGRVEAFINRVSNLTDIVTDLDSIFEAVNEILVLVSYVSCVDSD